MMNFKKTISNIKETINHKLVDKKILNEMSTVCKKNDGFGFIAQIYSKDHNPPHIHITETNKKELGKILITVTTPKNIADIKEYEGSIDNEIKKKIVKWANSKSKYNILNWDRAKIAWEDNHEEDDVVFS